MTTIGIPKKSILISTTKGNVMIIASTVMSRAERQSKNTVHEKTKGKMRIKTESGRATYGRARE